jgi:addiction module HigA family antidote
MPNRFEKGTKAGIQAAHAPKLVCHLAQPPLGLTLRDDVLPALALSVTDAADQLGVSRVALSRVVNGRAATSPVLALRLEPWLGTDLGGAAPVCGRPIRPTMTNGRPARSHREQEKGRTSLELCGLVCGAGAAHTFPYEGTQKSAKMPP